MGALDNLSSDVLFRASISSLTVLLKSEGKTERVIKRFNDLQELWVLMTLMFRPSPLYDSLEMEFNLMVKTYNKAK